MKVLNLQYNPFKSLDDNVLLLKDVEKRLLTLVEEFAEKENLSMESKNQLKALIKRGILERKTEYFFKRNMAGLSGQMESIMSHLMNDTKENPYDNKDLFYVNNTKHTIVYEPTQ